jgi:hypothetical protein
LAEIRGSVGDPYFMKTVKSCRTKKKNDALTEEDLGKVSGGLSIARGKRNPKRPRFFIPVNPDIEFRSNYD